MKSFLLVFLGGGMGSALRYVISRSLNSYYSHFFLGTFLVNILGCLLIGFVLTISLKSNLLTQQHVLLLSTGFCGGFTTFSAFALENHMLLREFSLIQVSLYMGLSIIVGILAVALGIWLGKLV